MAVSASASALALSSSQTHILFTFSRPRPHRKNLPRLRFGSLNTPCYGLRTSNKLDSIGLPSISSFQAHLRRVQSSARVQCVNASLVITLSTGALLFLGRFVFLPFQREQIAKAGLPKQNDGISHFEAGDIRAREVDSLLKTNDPAGFTIVDVLAWGALGHAVGFFLLATATNGYEPQF